jgi:hypothetical protein
MRTSRSKGITRDIVVARLVRMYPATSCGVTGRLANRARVSKTNWPPVGWAAILLVLFSAGATITFIACHSDRSESFYPTLAEADKDGAITRGWIPYYLPESSTDIHETHELSPSTEWCAFRFLLANSEGFRKKLESAQPPHASVKAVPIPGVSWWPDVLTGNLDEKSIGNAGFQIYVLVEPETSVTTEVLLFAVDWSKGRAYFYSRPGQ